MSLRKKPPNDWQERQTLVPTGYDAAAYQLGNLVAIISIDGAEHYLSCSKLPRTLPSDDEVKGVLSDFDMVGSEEDNSHSRNGYTRHFWRPTVQA